MNKSTSVVPGEAYVPPASILKVQVLPAWVSASRGLNSLKGVLTSNPSLDVPSESSHKCLPSLVSAGRAVLDPLGALKRSMGVTDKIQLKGDKVSVG